MPRMHDADLCRRIKELEDRVRELESRPTHYSCGCYHNHWHYTPSIPYVWNGTSTVTNDTFKISNTSYGIGDTAANNGYVQSTYTLTNPLTNPN